MLKREKILIASVDFPPHTDGVSTISGELADHFYDFGIDVLCIGPKSKKDMEYDKKRRYRIFRFYGYNLGYLRFFPFFFTFLIVFLRFRPKKVFAMNIGYGGLISYFLKKIFRFKYYLFGYGYEFEKIKRRFLKNVYLKIYENSENIFALSNFVKNRLIRFGVNEEKIFIVHPGTDPSKFYPAEIPERFLKEENLEFLKDKKIILSVGRLVMRKGFDMVIKSLPLVLKEIPDVYYLLVGDGPIKNYLKELAFKCGVEERVIFAGRRFPSQLLYFYNLCDLFIMPSREIKEKGDVEGFGIVFLEANACKKPVIGGKSGGVVDAVIDGYNGLLVNPEDENDIAKAIIKILSDKKLAERLGENGYKRVLNELNWENFSRKVYEFIK
ncbi:MAG TPA: glycosyltransferase family 1 protein [Firmicutes bacterium]|nr:glycosyltransferase family 1 protein [Bacillota bacterium]